MHTALDAAFADLVSAHPAFLTTRRSVLEGHCDAMALRDHATAPVDLRTTQGEIAHVHPGDGSLHMILAASDARAVIEGAWGERHPLAGVVPQLPSTYLLVYPPRDEEELKIVTGILEAAVRNAALSSAERTRRTAGSFGTAEEWCRRRMLIDRPRAARKLETRPTQQVTHAPPSILSRADTGGRAPLRTHTPVRREPAPDRAVAFPYGHLSRTPGGEPRLRAYRAERRWSSRAVVQAALAGHQVLVRAVFDDAPLVEDIDVVGVVQQQGRG
ncbi:hypothetical protein GCM10020295_01040 [Streptomyces cinereospinus]